MRRLTLIAAVADNGVIGRNGALPWHIPADLRFFKKMTMGHPLIMGRVTRDSLGLKPLPGRLHIVLSRQSDYRAEGSTIVPDWPQALAAAGDAAEVFVIGGAEVYASALPLAHRVIITRIAGEYEGDAYFPDLLRHPHLEVIERRV